MSAMRQLPILAAALVAGFTGAALFSWSGLSAHLGGENPGDYIVAHPEVLREASAELQRRELLARIGPLRSELEAPFPGAVLGNPRGSVTLVEFSDYACGYCRQSVADVEQLIADNPDLKVVVREYPILTEGSADAARMALAAAQQGKYAAFHNAMFEAGNPTAETIEMAANKAGVNLEQARSAIATGMFEEQLQGNLALAQSLGVTGTPSWVVGDQALTGAQGADRIGQAIAEARTS